MEILDICTLTDEKRHFMIMRWHCRPQGRQYAAHAFTFVFFPCRSIKEARPFPALPCEPEKLRSVCMDGALAETDSKTLFKHIEIEIFRQGIREKLMIVFYEYQKWI